MLTTFSPTETVLMPSVTKETKTTSLCICICVFGCQTLGNIVFEVLVRFPFQKYITSWVFLAFELYVDGWDGYGYGWDLCAGLLYEHRFAMLIRILQVLLHLKIKSKMGEGLKLYWVP